ncbi:hypothetical protein [Enterococcus faecium]|uniref:Uncharacterized protein n=1 Tax=Enterococcus faecium TaxID=1352 RepID=A0A242BGN6_ENTFC|nr:hypothetical protein [Enterococcus faecium]OTN94489.1 hypothetical protein A5810_000732 [Enterococcus faecium]
MTVKFENATKEQYELDEYIAKIGNNAGYSQDEIDKIQYFYDEYCYLCYQATPNDERELIKAVRLFKNKNDILAEFKELR